MGECPHGMPSPASCTDCMFDDGLGADPVAPLVGVGSPFEAKFPGPCTAGCGYPIEAGEMIARMSDHTYQHAACVERWEDGHAPR